METFRSDRLALSQPGLQVDDTSKLARLIMSRTAETSDVRGTVYYIGKACCQLPFEGEFGGGIFIDVSVGDNRNYEYRCFVRHSQPPEGRTQLRVWDHGNEWEVSAHRPVKTGTTPGGSSGALDSRRELPALPRGTTSKWRFLH